MDTFRVKIGSGYQVPNFHMGHIEISNVYHLQIWTRVRVIVVRYDTCKTVALKMKYVWCVAVVNSGGREVGVLKWRQKVSLPAEWLILSSSCAIHIK